MHLSQSSQSSLSFWASQASNVWRRARRAIARPGIMAFALYGVIAIALLAPMASNYYIPPAEHANHIGMLVQGRMALQEGQFPIRVAPWQHSGWQYPLFQFYSPLVYTIGGLVHQWITPQNPFMAFKLVVWGTLLAAGFFMYLTAHFLTRSRPAAVLAGVIYMSSPYVLVNLYARGAFTEAVSQGVLAIVVYCTVRCYFASAFSPWLLASAVSWAMLAQAHNITYVWGAVFVGLLFVLIALGRRGVDPGLWRVGAAFVLGCLLALHFLAPVVAADYLRIRELIPNIYDMAWLTPLPALLSPTSLPPEPHPGHLTTPLLHPNIGWPMLLGAAVVLYAFWRPLDSAIGSGPRARRVAGALVALFLFAVFLTWTPVDFWIYLPRAANIAQFSYRMLAQVAWTGALLSAYGLVVMFRGRLELPHAVVGVLLILMAHSSFLPPLLSAIPKPNDILTSPDIGYGRTDYLADVRKFPSFSATGDSLLVPLVHHDGWLKTDGPADISREFLRGATVPELRMHGVVPGDVFPAGLTLTLAIDGRQVIERQVKPGDVDVSYPLDQALAQSSSPSVRIRFSVDRTFRPRDRDPVARDTRSLAIMGTSVVITGLHPIEMVPVQALRLNCLRQALTVNCHIPVTDRTKNVQLPAFFYPDLETVEANGKTISYFPLPYQDELLTGVQLDPGVYDLTIRFHGLVWANVISAIAWIGTLLALAFPIVWPRIRRPRVAPVGV